MDESGFQDRAAQRLAPGRSAAVALLPGVTGVRLGDEHLADLPDTALAVRTRLTTVLDLPDGARASSDLFGDATIGDTLADADEHGRLA